MRCLLTPRWLLAHLLAAAAVVTFLALGWWQIGRAASGNALSYGYAVEWPVFAGFVVFVWFTEARKNVRAARPVAKPTSGSCSSTTSTAAPALIEPHSSVPLSGSAVAPSAVPPSGSAVPPSALLSSAVAARTARLPGLRHTGPAYDDSDDEQLAAYNRYLAWLNANPQATPAQYPG